MRHILTLILIIILTSCATIVNDPTVPVSLSFSDGSEGECKAFNKRVSLQVRIPSTPMVRRSDDALILDCTTDDGREAFANIPSTLEGGKLAGSVVFFDLGITDAITDKHRIYPASYVIPITKSSSSNKTQGLTKEEKLRELKELKDKELISEETFLKYQDEILSN